MFGKDQDARDNQKSSVRRRLENKAERDAERDEVQLLATKVLYDVVRTLCRPMPLEEFRKLSVNAPTQAERAWYMGLADRRTCFKVLMELYDRVCGKPKQATELSGNIDANMSGGLASLDVTNLNPDALLQFLTDLQR